MVKKYPSNEEELRRHRESVPLSELKFYQIIDALNDNWYIWHSVRWNEHKTVKSGEADYLIFNPQLGFIVLEVKGGIISVEDGIFYTTNTKTYQKFKLSTDPFSQAETSMHHILGFYVNKAKLELYPNTVLKNNNLFPLSFNYAVFFPDCRFKRGFEYLQYNFNKIFDESDLIKQIEWQGNKLGGVSPLESFLINLLSPFKKFRVSKPAVAEFFPKLIGSDISRYINLKKYYANREQELESVNQVQDFLLDALSVKQHCVFKGSAGSGKTFIAMKKVLINYERRISTLLLCFNSELRESMRQYISKQLDKPYEKIKGRVNVSSINMFLMSVIKVMFDGDTERSLIKDLSEFVYGSIATELSKNRDKIPISFLYESIIIDEAQDIDISIRKIITSFLKDPTSSQFYVFYDEEQAIFVDNFSINDFGMNESRDLILLNRNLRNTVEIANWLRFKTSYGKYAEFSGINGFKISSNRFQNPKKALIKAMDTIKKKYLTQGISPEKIGVLSYYKLKTLIPEVKTNSSCDYYKLTDKNTGEKVYLIEPNNIAAMNDIKCLEEINCEWCIMFKTISSFKGLESDILFLVVPNLEGFKTNHPEKYENYLMQMYVGASRAKFKLYFLEY